MAVAVITIHHTDPAAGPEIYTKMRAVMDLDDNPAEGLIFSWVGNVDGKWTITDVWESQEDFERFRTERLAPAIPQVYGPDRATAPPTVVKAAVHHYRQGA